METVRLFIRRGDAEVAAARLRAAGIESLVAADDEGGLNPGFYRSYGVRLTVLPQDLAAAREILGLGPIEVPEQALEAMRAHTAFCAPAEACGLLAFDADGRLRMVYPCTNGDASPHRFTVDPREHLMASRSAEARSWEIAGLFHSHPSGPAVPSATDVERHPDPSWVSLIIGGDGEVRAFVIDDVATEVPIRVRR